MHKLLLDTVSGIMSSDQCVLMQKVKRKAGVHAGMMSSARAVLQDLEAHRIPPYLLYCTCSSQTSRSTCFDIHKLLPDMVSAIYVT